jgi:hypothetical protein
MNELREKLEKALAEHQQESGLHMIGGREKLIQRLLKELNSPALGKQQSENGAEQNGACC